MRSDALKRLGLIVESAPADGGVHSYTRAVIDGLVPLVAEGWEITIASVRPWTPEMKLQDGVRRLQLPQKRIPDLITKAGILIGMKPVTVQALSRGVNPGTDWIRRQHWDLCLSTKQQDLAVYWSPCPCVVAIHDLMHRFQPGFPEVSGLLRRRYRDRHLQAASELAVSVLVDSALGQTHVSHSYGTEETKLHVLPYPSPAISGQPAHEHQAPPFEVPRKFLFYPAQFWKHKNHVGLLRAVARARSRQPDIALVLVGAPKNAYSEVLASVKMLDLGSSVLVLGFVAPEWIPWLYAKARALVMPTFFGPTNIPPLEAFAYGCPVAVSRIYGMPEQLGDAALFFDPSNEQEMATVIESLWSDDALCATLREKGLRRAAQWTTADFGARLRGHVRDLFSKIEGSSRPDCRGPS